MFERNREIYTLESNEREFSKMNQVIIIDDREKEDDCALKNPY